MIVEEMEDVVVWRIKGLEFPEKMFLHYLYLEPSSAKLLDFTLEAGMWNQGTGHWIKARDLLLSFLLLCQQRMANRIQKDCNILTLETSSSSCSYSPSPPIQLSILRCQF